LRLAEQRGAEKGFVRLKRQGQSPGTRGVPQFPARMNVGRRPPAPTATPGCAKAPEVLRAAGLYQRLGAADAGLVRCPRYVDDARPGRIRNQDAILDYSIRLAGPPTALPDQGPQPPRLRGDRSLLPG